MGCGASVFCNSRDLKGRRVGREYSAAIANLRAFSSFFSDGPLPAGTLDVLQLPEKRDIRQYYAFGRIIGKGQFGTCRLVTEKATGDRYACKSLSKRRLMTQNDILDVRREVQIMYHLAGHPNIVQIKEVFEDRTHVHMVEELCSGGELFDSIVERGHFSERDAAAAFRCIAAVVAHCHVMGVMHRDIKPENFLLSSRVEGSCLKGTDFGLSCFFSEGQVFRDVVGSAFYVAPEVLRKRYDKRADIWSLGVLLYILLSGMPPFYGETERDIFQAILHAPLLFEKEPWPSISEGAKDIIRRMLVRNVAVRATAQEVLQHEWVREDGTAGSAPINNEVLQRLQNFAALNKLQQEALKVIATHLPESEITGLRALFTEMDADGSGSITVDELREALQRKGTRIPAEELQRIMAHADLSGDGTLDYEEFLAATINLAKLEHEEHLYMAFKFFDTDDSGFISREELHAALHKACSEREIDDLMAQADSSGDGRIDYGEFCDLMRSGRSDLARATRVVKQGLMRTVRSQPLIDLQKLRVDSVDCGFIPPGPPGAHGSAAGPPGHLPPLPVIPARGTATGLAPPPSRGAAQSPGRASLQSTGRSSLTLLAQPRRLQTSSHLAAVNAEQEREQQRRSGDGRGRGVRPETPPSPAALPTLPEDIGVAMMQGVMAAELQPLLPPPDPTKPPSAAASVTAASLPGAAAPPQPAALKRASTSALTSASAASRASVSSPRSSVSRTTTATPPRSTPGRTTPVMTPSAAQSSLLASPMEMGLTALHAVSFRSTIGE